MPTKWNSLSSAQREVLLLVANRPESAMRLQMLNTRCNKGVVSPYAREDRRTTYTGQENPFLTRTSMRTWRDDC